MPVFRSKPIASPSKITSRALISCQAAWARSGNIGVVFSKLRVKVLIKPSVLKSNSVNDSFSFSIFFRLKCICKRVPSYFGSTATLPILVIISSAVGSLWHKPDITGTPNRTLKSFRPSRPLALTNRAILPISAWTLKASSMIFLCDLSPSNIQDRASKIVRSEKPKRRRPKGMRTTYLTLNSSRKPKSSAIFLTFLSTEPAPPSSAIANNIS